MIIPQHEKSELERRYYPAPFLPILYPDTLGKPLLSNEQKTEKGTAFSNGILKKSKIFSICDKYWQEYGKK